VYEEEYTVCKLQVGIFGDISVWQNKLEKVGSMYDTDEEDGLHSIFKEVIMFLLRNTEYCGYVSSAGKVFNDLDEAERKFSSVSLEERTKFKEETFSNVNGRQRAGKLEEKSSGGGLDTWMCVTLVMAVDGALKIPKINSVWEFKKVLTELGGLGVDDLVAFELLWTPQEAGDHYSKDELLADYPTMLTLS